MDSNDWLVIVGFLTFGIVAWQAWETRKAAESGSKTANEAMRQATAAENAARIAQNQMVLTLRARLNVERLTVKGFDVGEVVNPVVALKNFGGKGAYISRYYICISLTQRMPDQALYPTADSDKWVEVGLPLEAGATHEIDGLWNRTLDQATLNELNAGSRALVVWGAVDYDSGFNQTRRIGFARAYSPELSKRREALVFEPIGGKAYNYAQ